MNEHNLVYIRKEDGKIFHVRRLACNEYSMKDPITGEKETITAHFLKKKYECVSSFSDSAKKKMLDFSFARPSLHKQEKQLA